MKNTFIDYHLRFWRFHNRHIEFILPNGKLTSGVLVDTLSKERQEVHTQYAFIHSKDRREWKNAIECGDVKRSESFEKVFDIRNIERVMCVL